MAREVWSFAVSIPIGTTAAAPAITNLTMPPRLVEAIDWRVPPGPGGMMGFALAAAGVPIIPANPGGWIITDNEADSWQVQGQLESGAWQLAGYNTGLFPHTVYLRFHVNLVSDVAGASVPPPITSELLTPMTPDQLAAVTSGNLDAATLADLQAIGAAAPSLDGVQ